MALLMVSIGRRSQMRGRAQRGSRSFKKLPRTQLVVKPHVEQERCWFHPGHQPSDQLFTRTGVLRGSPEVHRCFVDPGPWGCSAGGAVGAWRRRSLLRAIQRTLQVMTSQTKLDGRRMKRRFMHLARRS